MIEIRAMREGFGGFREGGRPRRRRPDVEGPAIVDAVVAGEQRAPVDIAEQPPEGHRADIHAVLPESLRGAPGLGEPAQLLVARAAMMDFGDRDRNSVALPCFGEA